MKQDYLYFAWKNLSNRRLRSYLTIVGIVIGVTSLIALITLGQGLTAGVTQTFDKFGTNIIWVAPKQAGTFGGPPLGVGVFTEEDAETIEKLPIVDFVGPFVAEGMPVVYNQEEQRRDIFAPKASIMRRMLENVDIRLSEGRFLESGDNNVAVIGYRVHHDLFDKTIPLRANLRISGEKFRVIGIKEEQGVAQEDNQIMIPLEDMQEMLNLTDDISAFSAVIHDGIDMDEAVARIERELERKRDEEDFEITSPVKVKEQTGAILSLVQLVVAAIAAISLIVGGLGIMNTMYSSTLERTREIGVMKAIGASHKDILAMFLIESGCIGVIGGVIGIALGLGISYGAAEVINQFGIAQIHLAFSAELVAFALVFAFVLGSIAGSLPAWRAAQLDPVQALRYE